MKHVACSECQQFAPLSETLLVKQQHVCSACVEEVLGQATERGITKADVSRAADPTVCTQCKTDNGDEDLPLLAGSPICPTCESGFRNRPYPAWLKVSFVALVGLAVFSFAWNWRFIAALREIQQMQRAMAVPDFPRAANMAERAARHVPEVPELVGIAYFSRGLDLLAKEQSAKAVDSFRKAKQSPGSGALPDIDRFLLEAEAGAAFDAKNYDEFLAKCQAIASGLPRDPVGAAKVASGYACKFAVTGREEYRRESLKQLDKAAKLAGPSDSSFQEFRLRILHRLDSREIISAAEFARRFPNGYKPKAKS